MTLHLYLAALFTPVMLILAASGGLYLFGYKGEMEKGTPVFVDKVSLFDETGNTHDRVKNLLVEAGLDDDFKYIKQRGKKIQTRPTSRDHYEITEHKGGVKIVPSRLIYKPVCWNSIRGMALKSLKPLRRLWR